MITVPALSSVNDILDSDLIMVTHSNGESYKISGSDFKKAMAVDTVALNNMHSVTSNAVAQRFNSLSYANVPIENHGDKIYLYKFGKVVFMSLSSDWSSLSAGESLNVATIPQGYRPIAPIRIREASLTPVTLFLSPDGSVNCYNYGSAISEAANGWYYACWITEE